MSCSPIECVICVSGETPWKTRRSVCVPFIAPRFEDGDGVRRWRIVRIIRVRSTRRPRPLRLSKRTERNKRKKDENTRFAIVFLGTRDENVVVPINRRSVRDKPKGYYAGMCGGRCNKYSTPRSGVNLTRTWHISECCFAVRCWGIVEVSERMRERERENLVRRLAGGESNNFRNRIDPRARFSCQTLVTRAALPYAVAVPVHDVFSSSTANRERVL